MVAAFYYDRSDQRQALLPAGAVQCLRGAQQTPTLAAWWNAGNRWPNLVQLQSGTQITGALLMLGTTDDLTRALAYAGGVNDIDGISCTDDWLVAFYVRCYIAGTGVLGLAGRNYTVVSVAPLYKYWGHTRQSLPMGHGVSGWWPLYPSAQQQDIYNGSILLGTIREGVRQLAGTPAFPGLQF